MKKIFIEALSIIAIAIIAALIFNAASGNNINITKKYKKIEHVDEKYNVEKIDIEIFKFYLDKPGIIVLDARPESEFKKSHIPGASSFSVNNFRAIFRERGELLKLGKTVLVYCSGPTCEDSHQLAAKLSKEGISDIFVFTGGMEKWIEAGFETEGEGIQ